MTYYVIRHGESEANAAGVTAGQSDSPLTRKGIQQARDAAGMLQRRGIAIDHITSSPLSRSYDTAVTIAKGINYLGDITVAPDLIERGFGSYEGGPIGAVNGVPKDEVNAAGVESESALMERVCRVVATLSAAEPGNTLLVSHNGFARRLLALVKGTSVDQIDQLPNAQVVALCNNQQLTEVQAILVRNKATV